MPVVLYWLCFCFLFAIPMEGAEIRATFAMDEDPLFQVPPPKKIFAKGFVEVWLQALARPDGDLQRQCAETIAQAHEFGYPGLTKARPHLLEIVTAEGTHPETRFAAARALLVMETQDAAPKLFEVSQAHGADLRQLIEPKLGVWKFQPMLQVWRERLGNPATRFRDLNLAIEGVGQWNDAQAVPHLLKLTLDRLQPPAARLATARSAGTIQRSGLEADAAKLIKSGKATLIDRLCSLSLIINHDSEAARTQLLQFAVDVEPSIAAAALGRLLVLNPDLVLPLSIVRQRGADAFIARPTPERVVSLVRLLDDPHPGVRGAVREALYQHTKSADLDAVLRPAFLKTLAGDNWRGQEQAALLLGVLDHEVAAPRLVELLESPRDEVMTTAAWALRKLAVAETLPAILEKATRQTVARTSGVMQPQSLDSQVVHLFEAMGLMKYAPAEPLLMKYVPKTFVLGEYSRAAAIWALGHMYENRPEERLVKQFSARMQDIGSLPPEVLQVQVMSTIALGRMKAESEIPVIRKLFADSRSPTQPSMGYRWAIMRITGESIPEPESATYSKTAWFLSPLNEATVDPSEDAIPPGK